MALDIGACLLAKGHDVAWATGDAARLPELSRRTERLRRRAAKAAGGSSPSVSAYLREDLSVPPPACIVECTRESLDEKRAACASVEHLLESTTLLLSNSSSILPQDINPRCIGMHFFRPLQLTELAELVCTPNCPSPLRDRALAFARGLGLTVLQQNERSAFTLNRLLLPLQAEVVRALHEGFTAAQVDRDSASQLFAVGQLSFMDTVGLDVIRPAVANYIGRMPEEQACAFAVLDDTLDRLLAMGKRGTKNSDGFLCGAALPWARPEPAEASAPPLAERLFLALLNTCASFVGQGLIAEEELNHALRVVAGAQTTLAEALRATPAFPDRARNLYESTGISYFQPGKCHC
jgi:3-hydroxybutyryl-CoA dehydrogenase